MTHFFELAPFHPRSKPGFNVWRCNICDSEALFPKKFDQRYVNRVVGENLPCVPTKSEKIIVNKANDNNKQITKA